MKQYILTTFALTLFLLSGLQAQTISVDPNSGFQNDALAVTISGVGTQFQSATTTCGPLNASTLIFHQGSETLDIPSVFIVDEEQINVPLWIPNGAAYGLYDVTIWPDSAPGCEITCEGCFEVLHPGNITDLDINTGGQGEELKVTISGENTYWSQASPCAIDASNVMFSQGSSTIFMPDNVVVLDTDTLCVFMTVPDGINLGLFDVQVGVGLGCETSCENCFEVNFPPTIEIFSELQGGQGEPTIFNLGANFGATYADCELTLNNVFLQLGAYIIYPTSIEIVNDELFATFDIPEDAPVGDYDVIVGDGLDYECNYSCEGCYQITTPPNIVLPPNTEAEQGTSTTLSIAIENGTYEDCVLTAENVYLVLGNDIIYPTSVEIVNGELVTSFDIPPNAVIGNYDLVIGDGLDVYGCSFECAGCFMVSETTGIDPIFDAALSIYPNPFQDQIQLSSDIVLHEVSLQLYDVLGHLVLENQWSQLQSEVIHTTDLPKGVYTLKIVADEGERYKRIVRQ